jgi:hypothetical protein
MTAADADEVARLHHAAMGSSLWARLGRPFLARLYGALVEHPMFLGAVYEEDGRIRGFIAGTEDAGSLLRDTFRRRWHRLVGPVARGILGDRSLLRPILATPRYAETVPAGHVKAESLFCSFEPDLRGKRVSGHINKVLFDELAARGHDRVKITTEQDNEAALRQLASWGFRPAGTFRFYDKPMVALVLDLSTSPRVEPVRRWPAT